MLGGGGRRISFFSFSKGLVSSLMPAVIYFDSYLIEFCFMPTKKKLLCCESQRNKERAQTEEKARGTERKARPEIKKDETSTAAG